MKSRPALAVFLACVIMGASASLHAQARGPAAHEIRSNQQQAEKRPLVLDAAARARMTALMEVWLGRLVGRFRVDAIITTVGGSNKTHGTAVCSRFGDGPGVRCVIQDIHGNKVERDHGTLPLLYFGINPEALEIQLVIVDLEQVAARSGVLTGDTVDFSDNWKVCFETWTHCWSAEQITAKSAEEIFMKIAVDQWLQGRKAPILLKSGHTVELEVHLYREPPVETHVPGNAL